MKPYGLKRGDCGKRCRGCNDCEGVSAPRYVGGRRAVAARLPVDPEADARFAALKRALVRPIPRVVLTPKPAPVKVADHVFRRRAR
jgi:hypothetical protein